MSFLDFTGKVYEFNDHYYFQMKKENTSLKSSCVTEILNPVLDSTFKFVFLQNADITKNFLNSLNFLGKDEIKELVIIKNEPPKPTGGRSEKDIKRIDVGVKCTLGKKDDKEKFIPLNEEKKNLNTIIIDIEMQIEIGFIKQEDYSKRFIGYAKQLYASQKVGKVYVIVLVLSPKKLSRTKSNSLTEESIQKFSTIKEYDFMTIIKIDLNYCLKLLEENKGIWILNSKNILNKEGEEWIKYLTIPLWCDKSDNGHYQFPNIADDNFFVNECVYQALIRLAKKNKDEFNKYDEESSSFEKDRKMCETKDELLEAKDKLLETKDKLFEKNEELESLKEKYNEMKKEMAKLKKKKHISPKSKSLKKLKKNNKSSNNREKRYKYPKDEIIEEEEQSDGEVEKGEEKEEKERDEDPEEEEGEESRDSDYYPNKSDLEEEEKKDGNKDRDNNKKEDGDHYMDIE